MARPKKYGEKTIAFPVRIPISRQEEAKKAIRKALKQFEIKKS